MRASKTRRDLRHDRRETPVEAKPSDGRYLIQQPLLE